VNLRELNYFGYEKITQTGELLDLQNLLDMISLEKRRINCSGR
jgi:hypothetical protein